MMTEHLQALDKQVVKPLETGCDDSSRWPARPEERRQLDLARITVSNRTIV